MESSKQKIKIIQVVTGLVPGGAERLLLDMMQEFDATRFDVRLVSIVDDLRALQVYGHPDQKVDVFDMRAGKRIRNFQRLRDFIKAFAPHVIHAHMFHSLLAVALATRRLKRAPKLCFTSHLDPYPFTRAALVCALKTWRDADIVFESGQHPRMNVQDTRVIPNGVPVPSQLPRRTQWAAGGTVRLLSVGRLADQKDPLGLLRSIARTALPNVTLDFVGSGPLEGAARALASELGLANQVRFLGLRSDVRECMRNADMFVMHSESEGMPMALLEAGAAAMPVLATPVGSIPSVLGDDRGWVVSREQFAEVLDGVLKDPKAAISAGKRLYRHVSEFHSIRATTRQHEELYQDLIGSVSPQR